MNTGRSPIISALPTSVSKRVTPDLHEDIILAGGTKRTFYSPNPKPPTASWLDFRNRHLYQMQQKTRIQRNNFGMTTSDETTSPSSSTSEGEGSIAETELMIHQDTNSEDRNITRKGLKPPKPPRLIQSRADVGHLPTNFKGPTDNLRISSSKSSSGEITPAPPPPPMPPMQSFSRNTRHLGHVTGITETLQNRMANAAVSAASEARARKVSRL